MTDEPPDFVDDLYNAVATVIAATCPEVLPNPGMDGKVAGIMDSEHADTIPWANLRPPYAVVLIENMPRDAESSGINAEFLASVEIFYIAETHGPVTGIRRKLAKLDAAFEPITKPEMQVLRVRDMSWSSMLEVNQILVGAGKAHRAGRIIVDCLITRPIPPPA